MTDKGSPPNWQRLKLADFGKPAEQARPNLANLSLAQKNQQTTEAKSEHDQTKGFLRGYDDGLVAGRFEGYSVGEAAGASEGRQAAHQLLTLAANMDKALVDLDHDIAEEVLALALEIAKQTLRQAISIKSEAVLPIVREALAQLPHQHSAIYLHPDDAALVRKYAGDQLGHGGHHINEDPRLQRGDVVVEANGAQVDATTATRWRRIVESIGGNTTWFDEERS